MTSPFAVTPSTSTLSLDAKRQGTVTFTVKNETKMRIRSRACLNAAPPEGAMWLVPVPPPEVTPGTQVDPLMRDFAPDETATYTVNVVVPPHAASGEYRFHLLIANEANPDEDFTQGADVGFFVAPAEQKKPPPRLPIVLAVVLVGIVLILLTLAASGVFSPAPNVYDGWTRFEVLDWHVMVPPGWYVQGTGEIAAGDSAVMANSPRVASEAIVGFSSVTLLPDEFAVLVGNDTRELQDGTLFSLEDQIANIMGIWGAGMRQMDRTPINGRPAFVIIARVGDNDAAFIGVEYNESRLTSLSAITPANEIDALLPTLEAIAASVEWME